MRKKNFLCFTLFRGGGLDQKCESSHFFFFFRVRTSLSQHHYVDFIKDLLFRHTVNLSNKKLNKGIDKIREID